MKILHLDIETAPHLAYVWGLWDENIPLQRIVRPGYTLSWAAKWNGSENVHYSDVTFGNENMLKELHKLLEEADVIVHYNGKKFDIPTINKEFIKIGLQPPSPYKQIDLLTVVRSNFKFASNKLDFVCKELGIGGKVEHRGFDLWIECMAGDLRAFQELMDYNIGDVELLELLYIKLRPWIKNHPNAAVYAQVDGLICPKCGSKHHQKRGFAYTNACKYQRYQCNDCKGWFRDNINLGHKAKERFNGNV